MPIFVMIVDITNPFIRSESGLCPGSLTWPDRYFSAGAYRLEIISARTEKGLVQFV